MTDTKTKTIAGVKVTQKTYTIVLVCQVIVSGLVMMNVGGVKDNIIQGLQSPTVTEVR